MRAEVGLDDPRRNRQHEAEQAAEDLDQGVGQRDGGAAVAAAAADHAEDGARADVLQQPSTLEVGRGLGALAGSVDSG